MTFNNRKKKICVVTTSRADYGRMKPVMDAIRSHPKLELQIVVGTPLFFEHLFWYIRHGEPTSFFKSLPWYLKARATALFGSKKNMEEREYLSRLIRRDGFSIDARLPFFLEGGNPRVMVKSAGFALLGIPKIFEKLRPDIVLIHGDRFEILPVAMAAAFLNIPLAHIEGGDVSGTIDNSIRHAVSKLSHIHFPVTEKSRSRLIQMGEDPGRVFLTGSSIVDFLKSIDFSNGALWYEKYGFRNLGEGILEKRGRRVNIAGPVICVTHHPVTTEYHLNYGNTKELIAALDALKMPTFFVTPNIDAGADGVSTAMREYRDRVRPEFAFFFKDLSPEDFCRMLNDAAVAVGNSSSFLREGGYLGTPAVVVGNRQHEREHGLNIISVGFDRNEIIKAIKSQVSHGKYAPTTIFGDGTASQKIATILADINLESFTFQKKFHE